MTKYEQFNLEDFILDDCFREWVLNINTRHDGFWREWIAHHPDMWTVIEEAKEMIQSLQHQPANISQEEIDRSFIEVSKHFDKTVQNKSKWTNAFLMKVAAAALVLVITALGILYQHQPEKQTKQFITEQGQRKMVELPDGSRVYLKGNSRLSYFPVWEKRRERRVTLQGEAYFQVKEQIYQGNKVKFIVVTDEVSIEVVGTEFIVNHTSQRTRVQLNSGKVRLKIKGQRRPVTMAPGDVVAFFASNRKVVNQRQDPGPRNTWLKTFENSGASAKQARSRKNTGNSGNQINAPSRHVVSPSGSLQKDLQNQADGVWSNRQRDGSSNNAQGPIPQQVNSAAKGQDNQQGGSTQTNHPQYILQQEMGGKQQKSTNLGTILQQGEDNQAYIKQIGENLKSQQTQSGDNNQAEAIFSGNNLKDGSDDLEWSSQQLQWGDGNISFFRIMESYNTNIYSTQKGYENLVEVESKGFENKGIILQEGNYNEALIMQEGSFNRAGIDPLSPGVLQQGHYNEINIMQSGPGNSTQNIQQGNNNTIRVDQNGN